MAAKGPAGSKKSSSKLILTIYLNILVVCAQGGVGLWINSLSLLSDALHNFSDVISLIVSIVALRLAARVSSLKKTFGFKRAEVVAALFNGLLLVIFSLLLVKEAVFRLFSPVEVESFWIVVLAAFSFCVNLGCGLLLKQDASSNINIRSSYIHLLSDAMTSLVIVVGGFSIYYTKAFWLDACLTLMVSLYLMYHGWKIIKEALHFIMHFVPSSLDIKKISDEVLLIKDIDNIHHVHLWQLTDQEVHIEAHIDFKKDLPLSEVTSILLEVRKRLFDKFGINHVTLQPEVNLKDNKQLVFED